jgi:hypothetical protein
VIITDHLAWVHLPKTAGTSTDRLFAASGVRLLWRDDQASPVKHLPPAEHPRAAELPLAGRLPVANFRRLPGWLLSNLQHKRLKMDLEVDAAPMRQGLFWRERRQAWLPADWWLERFGIDEGWELLRCERLKGDLLRLLRRHEGLGLRGSLRVLAVPAANRNRYRRGLEEWFSADDLAAAYAANPRWAALERRLYGSLLLEP